MNREPKFDVFDIDDAELYRIPDRACRADAWIGFSPPDCKGEATLVLTHEKLQTFSCDTCYAHVLITSKTMLTAESIVDWFRKNVDSRMWR